MRPKQSQTIARSSRSSHLHNEISGAVGNDRAVRRHHCRGVGLQDDGGAVNDLPDVKQSAAIKSRVKLLRFPLRRNNVRSFLIMASAVLALFATVTPRMVGV